MAKNDIEIYLQADGFYAGHTMKVPTTPQTPSTVPEPAEGQTAKGKKTRKKR